MTDELIDGQVYRLDLGNENAYHFDDGIVVATTSAGAVQSFQPLSPRVAFPTLRGSAIEGVVVLMALHVMTATICYAVLTR